MVEGRDEDQTSITQVAMEGRILSSRPAGGVAAEENTSVAAVMKVIISIRFEIFLFFLFFDACCLSWLIWSP